MKRFVSVVLALTLVLVFLAGCGNSVSESEAPASSPAKTEAPAESTQPVTSEAPAESVVIRLGFAVSVDTVPGQAFTLLKQEVEDKTDGRVQIELYENATLGNDRDLIEGLSLGTVEMAGAALSPLINFSSDFQVWDLPYVVENSEEGLQRAFSVMDGDIGKAMWASVENINIKGLFISYTGFRNMINTKRDVASPADLKGLKIRTMENSIHQAFYTAAGATPVALASSEAFTALQQGTIDGMDNVLDAMSDQGAFDVAKHLTLTEHFVGGYVLMIAKDFFEGLSDEDQAVILDAAETAKLKTRELAETCREDYIAIAEEKGVTVSYVDYSEWKPAAQNVWSDYKDKINQDWLNALTGES